MRKFLYAFAHIFTHTVGLQSGGNEIDVLAVGADRRRDAEHAGLRASGARPVPRHDRLSDAICADRAAGKRGLQRRQTPPGSRVRTGHWSRRCVALQPARLLRRRYC